MTKFFITSIGRLRLLAFLEGISLLFLVFIAVPIKHYFKDASLVQGTGPIHGALFLLFVLNSLSVGVEQNWKFKETTWKVILEHVLEGNVSCD